MINVKQYGMNGVNELLGTATRNQGCRLLLDFYIIDRRLLLHDWLLHLPHLSYVVHWQPYLY